MSFWLIEAAYLVASALFVFSLHWMNDPKTARKGVLAGVVAMALAILGTFLNPGIVNWGWIAGAVAAGFALGVPLSWVPLTAVPQRTAVSHAFGGLAAGLVGGRAGRRASRRSARPPSWPR
jgi:NAD(P) transhydrogenase subunit beta